MLEVRIICLGTLKEKYLIDAADEYAKRLGAFCKIKIIELEEVQGTKERALEDEAVKIKKHLKGFVVALDINGQELSSEAFAKKIDEIMVKGNGAVSFVVGSSCGLSDNIKNSADLRLSFSRLTLPHQLFRVVLLEQIYRAFNIMGGTPYHK